ncbi:MAG: hypothetical protein MZU95_01800 [Desulfomicrobium escambiense]|nr:hypothetical protein [Desulfomicrobium escambiense]
MLSRTAWDSRPVRLRPPERGFKLSLPMTVEGPDPDGDVLPRGDDPRLHEPPGRPLPAAKPGRPRLPAEARRSSLPPKLGEGRSLNAGRQGDDRRRRPADGDGRAPQVALRLESRYLIQADAA